MKFQRYFLTTVTLFVVIFAAGLFIKDKNSPKNVSITDKLSYKVTQEEELGNYILLQMRIVKSQMTEVRKQVTAKQIVSVAMDILETQEQRKQFVTLLAIESKFDNKAKSHVGATGMGQIMPAYAKEFAAKCGIKNVSADDLMIPEINLTIAACRFRELMEIFPGQISLVLVSYNAGQNSNQIKQLQELRNLSTVETSSYLSKFMYLKEKTNAEQKKELVKQ
jgi:soluble lytic murein transglycosylase